MTAIPATSLEGALKGAEVVVCCGSGGVGKTTVAAVLAIQAARDGERAVVVTIDPARRLADALGLPDGLAAEPQRIELEAPGELWAMMLDTAATFDGLVRRHAADEDQANRILENPFYRNIASALSGTQEYMAAETLHQLHNDERFDRVIVDTPPSRNALDFLEAPGVLVVAHRRGVELERVQHVDRRLVVQDGGEAGGAHVVTGRQERDRAAGGCPLLLDGARELHRVGVDPSVEVVDVEQREGRPGRRRRGPTRTGS